MAVDMRNYRYSQPTLTDQDCPEGTSCVDINTFDELKALVIVMGNKIELLQQEILNR